MLTLFSFLGYKSILLLGIVFFLLTKLFTRNFDYWKKKNVPFIKPIPFFGNILNLALTCTTIGDLLDKFYRQMDEPFFGFYILNHPQLVVKDPELIKSILVKDFQNFDDRIVVGGDHDEITTAMLFTSKNPDWKIIRNKMTPVFTSGKLKIMTPLMNEVGKDLNNYLEKNKEQYSLEAKEICAKFSTDVLARCAFGIQAYCFENEDADFRIVGRKLTEFSFYTSIQQTSCFLFPVLVNLFKLRLFNKESIDFLRGAFWHSIKERKKNPNQKPVDVIDALIELAKDEEFKKKINFEGDRAVAQAVQFFVAGFETSSSTMAFTLYELCLQPELQKRLREEILATIEEHGGITYEGVNSMKYLNMCISETLRKYPILPFLDRRTRADYTIPGTEVVIEKGTAVFISLLGLHYDEKYFPNPQKFDPERFSDSNSANLTQFSYLPFGAGPRICIAERFGLMSTKLGLVHILSEYVVERTSDTPVPLVYDSKSVLLVTKSPLLMGFKKVA